MGARPRARAGGGAHARPQRGRHRHAPAARRARAALRRQGHPGRRRARSRSPQRARQCEIPIYAIALGTPDGEVEVQDSFGFTTRIHVPPDTETLKEIARISARPLLRRPPTPPSSRTIYARPRHPALLQAGQGGGHRRVRRRRAPAPARRRRAVDGLVRPAARAEPAPLGQLGDHGLVDAGAVARPRRRGRWPCAAPRSSRGPSRAVGDEPERADRRGGAEVLARVADRDALLRARAAGAHVASRPRAPWTPRAGSGGRRAGARCRASRATIAPLSTSRRSPWPASASSASASSGVDLAAEQVRDLAVQVPRRVVLEPARVALEQQRRAPEASISVEHRLALARHEAAREPLQLAVEHEPGAGLERVGAHAEQAGVVEQRARGAAPSR